MLESLTTIRNYLHNHTCTSSTLPINRNRIGVTTELRYMPLHPLNACTLVEQTCICVSVGLEFFAGEEPEDVEPVTDRDGDDFGVGLVHPVVEWKGLSCLDASEYVFIQLNESVDD